MIKMKYQNEFYLYCTKYVLITFDVNSITFSIYICQRQLCYITKKTNTITYFKNIISY